MPQTSALATHATRGGSWMLLEATKQDLLYVSDVDAVAVYAYPQGKLEGILRGFYISQGVCVDKKGHVYIADQGTGRVYEYAHGGKKRIKTLVSGDSVGCSVDPTTGNLAVTDLQGNGARGNGDVAVFKNASGNPTYYRDPVFNEYYFCGYDNKGNLFVDGQPYKGGTGAFLFAELPKGKSRFTDITLNQYMGWPAGVQWDGRYVAVGDQAVTNVYEFSISGSQGTLVATTKLDGATYVKQAWIQGHTLIAPNSVGGPGANVLFYTYPAGGTPIKTIPKGVTGPQGAAVSLAPNR
jgi:hypothetical protein